MPELEYDAVNMLVQLLYDGQQLLWQTSFRIETLVFIWFDRKLWPNSIIDHYFEKNINSRWLMPVLSLLASICLERNPTSVSPHSVESSRAVNKMSINKQYHWPILLCRSYRRTILGQEIRLKVCCVSTLCELCHWKERSWTLRQSWRRGCALHSTALLWKGKCIVCRCWCSTCALHTTAQLVTFTNHCTTELHPTHCMTFSKDHHEIHRCVKFL